MNRLHRVVVFLVAMVGGWVSMGLLPSTAHAQVVSGGKEKRIAAQHRNADFASSFRALNVDGDYDILVVGATQAFMDDSTSSRFDSQRASPCPKTAPALASSKSLIFPSQFLSTYLLLRTRISCHAQCKQIAPVRRLGRLFSQCL